MAQEWKREENVSRFRPETWPGLAACIRQETTAGGGEVWADVSPAETQASALNKTHISSQLARRRICAEYGFEGEVVACFIRVPSRHSHSGTDQNHEEATV